MARTRRAAGCTRDERTRGLHIILNMYYIFSALDTRVRHESKMLQFAAAAAALAVAAALALARGFIMTLWPA